MSAVWKAVTRKKILDSNQVEQSQLARVLNTFDLTALGVGSTLGVGVYVLAGNVARNTAGPSVILSFLIAALTSVFAGLCYAEFGARTPRAGSAYIYSYVSVGELVAFIIGWNLILEYVIGSASVARGLSVYFDTLINNTMQDFFREITPINVQYMSAYFDFFAFGFSVLLAVALAFGLKESSIVNNIITSLNVCVVLFVVIAGSIKADPSNWSVASNSSNPDIGKGGFFPFGIEGMIKGAATCFYGFVGFDCIATTGEEVKNPQKAIPVAIISSLAIIFLAYFGTSTVLTLMVPYYLQDINAPIPHAFEEVGWFVAKWIVAIGGLFGLFASLFGAMFPLPRIIYAMASDGIIFKFLGRINEKFKTPVTGTLLAGLLTGLMAALFELSQLVNMMSIGTLLAYTLVAACVLVLRYQRDDEVFQNMSPPLEGYTENDNNLQTSSENLLSQEESISVYKVTFYGFAKQIFNLNYVRLPTKTSELLAAVEVFLFCVLCLLLGLCAIYLSDPIAHGKLWAIVLTSSVGLAMLLVLLSLSLQPVSCKDLRFKVPLVPLIPALSILVNIYLMLMLDVTTWIRFAVWMAVGMPMYFISVFGCSNDVNKFSINKHANKISHVVQNHSYSEGKKINGISNLGFVEETLKTNGAANNGFDLSKHKNNRIDENGSSLVINETKDDLLRILNGDVSPNSEPSKKTVKPKAPSPPTVTITEEKQTESAMVNADSSSVSNVLAILDEVISKEEQNQHLHANEESNLERKSSFDSISLVSNVFKEESVIALIHQEDNNSVKDLLPVPNEELISSRKKESEDVLTKLDSPVNILENEIINENTLLNSNINEINNEEIRQEALEDTVNEITEDKNNNSDTYTIPPPPPLNLNLFEQNFQTVPRIPRVSVNYDNSFSTVNNPRIAGLENKINLEELADEIQKRSKFNSPEENQYSSHVITPPVDYEKEIDSVNKDENVTFGSEQHKLITSKLEQLLSRSISSPPPKILTKPEIPQENDITPSSPYSSLNYDDELLSEQLITLRRNNNVSESSGEEVDIKSKLNEILLRRSNRPGSRYNENNNVENTKSDMKQEQEKENTDQESDKQSDREIELEQISHREKMNDAFKSIRLRKVESFKKT